MGWLWCHKVHSTYRWPSTNIHTRNLHALLYSSPWTCPLKPQPLDKWAEPTSTLNPLLGGKTTWGRFSFSCLFFISFFFFAFSGYSLRDMSSTFFVVSPHIFLRSGGATAGTTPTRANTHCMCIPAPNSMKCATRRQVASLVATKVSDHGTSPPPLPTKKMRESTTRGKAHSPRRNN